jgi:hypothetical protein
MHIVQEILLGHGAGEDVALGELASLAVFEPIGAREILRPATAMLRMIRVDRLIFIWFLVGEAGWFSGW